MDAKLQTALAELSQFALVGTHVTELMRQALVCVTCICASDTGAIWELLPHGGARLYASTNWRTETLSPADVDADTIALLQYIVRAPTPLIVADWLRETRVVMPPFLRDRSVISAAYWIIYGQHQPFGVLSVDSITRRTFSNAELHGLQTVANLLAMAIERMQLDQTRAQRVEEAVEQAHLLASAQAKAVLEERQRLARDLHDSVTQSLYGVTLHAEAATRLLVAGEIATATDYLRELRDIAQDALKEMRLLIFELRPSALEQAGLVSALQARLDAVEGRVNVTTQLLVEDVHGLPPQIEQTLYRIAQEALNNVMKHAHARHIVVRLQQMPTSVVLDISDDGVGFDTATNESGGLGLRGIAERVDQLNGILHVQSAPGIGTQLHVEVVL